MTTPIPTTQQGAVVVNPGESFKILIQNDLPIQQPHEHEVLIKLTCTGLCHSEIRAVLAWGAYNPIIGHEGIGSVVKTGRNVSPGLLNQRVGVKWLYSACNECSLCTRGCHHYCPKQLNTSRHVPGTLQQYVIADSRFLTRIPDTVPDEVAAPLLCAGLTMAGALGRLEGVLQAGDFVVISGSGGGLGHIGIQIAARVNKYRVIAVDSGEDKEQLSLSAGAEVFIDYQSEDIASRVHELTGEGAHATIVVPGTKEAFAAASAFIRNMGFIVCVGLPPNEMHWPISATLCAARGISIVGSSVGTEDQMTDLLQQASAGLISPAVRVYDLSETSALINDLKDDAITGRAVVKLPLEKNTE
ncbi:putative alcohol dehydrogenase [Aspergillus californicus]